MQMLLRKWIHLEKLFHVSMVQKNYFVLGIFLSIVRQYWSHRCVCLCMHVSGSTSNQNSGSAIGETETLFLCQHRFIFPINLEIIIA